MNRRLLASAVLAFAVFALWTAIVRDGIVHGSRHSMWLEQEFGTWPSSIDRLDGSSTLEFAIFAPFGSAPATGSPTGNVIGRAAIGTEIDSADSHNVNGSRFVAPLVAGEVHSIAVYVAGPIDAAPYDQFQLAIYTDHDGGPDRLLAASDSTQLTADAWNWAAVDARLEPLTAYWLVYNSNGRTGAVNNATFQRVTGNVVDAAVQSTTTGPASELTSRITSLGDMLPMTVALVVVAVVALRRRERFAAIALLCGYVGALAVALGVRTWLFEPFGLYPSGHALRTVYVAMAVGWIVHRWWLTLAAYAGAAVVCLAAVHERGHFTDEIIGGVLLGMAAGLLVHAVSPARSTSPGRATGAEPADVVVEPDAIPA